MHLRRAVLLFGIVVGLAAVVAVLAPKPQDSQLLQRPPAPPPSPPPAAAPSLDVTVSFAHVPPTLSIPPGAHLVLTADVPSPGDVSFLGSVQAAEPGTPAVFDVLVPASGSFALAFDPSGAGAARHATVSVREGRG
jgi:hypothetical protein